MTTPEDRAFAAAWKIVSAWDGKITKPVLRKAIDAAIAETRIETLELNAWEREELFRFSAYGGTYLGYDADEQEKWKALAEKLKASKPVVPATNGGENG